MENVTRLLFMTVTHPRQLSPISHENIFILDRLHRRRDAWLGGVRGPNAGSALLRISRTNAPAPNAQYPDI